MSEVSTPPEGFSSFDLTDTDTFPSSPQPTTRANSVSLLSEHTLGRLSMENLVRTPLLTLCSRLCSFLLSGRLVLRLLQGIQVPVRFGLND